MSGYPTEAMYLIKEVEKATSIDVLKTSRSISVEKYPKCEMLDARIATGLRKLISNSHFKRTVNLEFQKAQKEDRFLRGREIAFMINEHFRMAGAHETILNFSKKVIDSRREQVRQQEELVMKEKALRTIRFEVCTRWEK